MNANRSMKRIVALRRLEEEREEAAVLRQRQLRDASLRARKAIEEEKALASGALYGALVAGDRSDAISAEMALACWPLRQYALEQELARRESLLELALQSYTETQLRRRQAETALEWMKQAERERNGLREQKALDDWAVRSHSMRQPWSATEDESSQRQDNISSTSDGTDRAGVDIG
jgi:hypothetical protein